jgi:opacity protein-like surface antigen
MRFIHLSLIILSTLLVTLSSYGQSYGGTNFSPRGINGYMGFGVASFTVLSPEAAFEMDQGQMVYLGADKQFGKSGIFITFSFNYMQTDGESFYNFTRLGGTQYFTNPGTEVNFSSDHLQLGLGLKFKMFPTSFFRPYGEGGGLFGYHTIEYSPRAGDINNADGSEKLKDSLTGFGYYLEAGIEIDFSESWGIRTGVRYQLTETGEFETLGDQKVKYETRAFHFGLARRF